MKKLFLCLMMGIYYPMVSIAQMDGSGTADDPYQVKTAFDLFDVRANLTAHYKLMNDIDLTEWIAKESPSQGWSPIGTQTTPFSGVFDGNKKSIKGLIINKPSVNNVGLFGVLDNASIHHLCLINPIIKGASYVGPIAGFILTVGTGKSSINNNAVIGGHLVGNNSLGGIIGGFGSGWEYASRSHMVVGNFSSIMITGDYYCGGICGNSRTGYYYNSVWYQYNSGIQNFVCFIQNNHYCGTINALGNIGGILGYSSRADSNDFYSRIFVQNNVVEGTIKGISNITGIVGNISSSAYKEYYYQSEFESSNSVVDNVCVADTLMATDDSSPIYRITDYAFSNNYAYNKTVTLSGAKAIEIEDNEYQGTSYGYTTLRRKNTYVGMGFDFDTQWAISEGSSLPYNINQSAPPTITSCTSGQHAKISGTAIADGTIYVFEGNNMYEGAIVDGKWEVQLGELAEGAIVKVSADTENLMSSILVSTKAESLAVVLDENFGSIPEPATGVDVLVRRTIKANEWSTICLPFAMNEAQVKAAFGNGVELADFTGYDATEDNEGNITGITANFSDVTAIEANHPYIIKVSSAVSEFTVDGVDIDPEDEPCIEYDNGKTGARRIVYSAFRGTYHVDTDVPEYSLFLMDNLFYYSAGNVRMKAYRAYFDFYDILTDVEDELGEAKIRMSFNDASGIESIRQRGNSDGAVYDLSGRRLSVSPVSTMLPRGMYIINGKKVIIK